MEPARRRFMKGLSERAAAGGVNRPRPCPPFLLLVVISLSMWCLFMRPGHALALSSGQPKAAEETGEETRVKKGGSSELDEVVRLLQERYDNTVDISANFRQKTFALGEEQAVEAEGRVWFKRPELMRWEYERPEKKLIVTSGTDVYLFEQEVNQVTVISRQRFLNSEISRAFFCGKGRLKEFFRIELACEDGDAEGRCWTLRLVPKRQAPNLKELILRLDSRSHLIEEVTLFDQLGGRTVIQFSQIKVNQHVPDSLFRFTIPAGAEVFRLD